MEYEAVIGMEVHVEINSKSKIFCACSTDFHAPPNTNVCPICLGMPGVLPVLNRDMVDKSVAVGLALNCTISRWSKLDRKNYFYPDMAKNYQISQYDLPLCFDGRLDIEIDGALKPIGITRAHMEEDTARNTHTLGGGNSGVDFNRSGVPLLEIVTEPDIRSAQEAHAYLTALKQILQYLNVSDCNMEEGSLRAEANISRAAQGSRGNRRHEDGGEKCSLLHPDVMPRHRIRDQAPGEGHRAKAARSCRKPAAGTPTSGITFSQRKKESAHDYRYFPEPDLVPVVVDEAWEQRIRAAQPELPLARKKRFEAEYGLSDYDAQVLTATQAMADYFEATARAGAPAKKAANWIMGDLQAMLVDAKTEIAACPIKAQDLAAMIALIEDATISGKMAKEVLTGMFTSGKPPQAIIEEKGLVQISDTGALDAVVQQVLAANPAQVEQYKAGSEKVLGFLMGQVMKATQGKANPKLVNDMLRKALNA